MQKKMFNVILMEINLQNRQEKLSLTVMRPFFCNLEFLYFVKDVSYYLHTVFRQLCTNSLQDLGLIYFAKFTSKHFSFYLTSDQRVAFVFITTAELYQLISGHTPIRDDYTKQNVYEMICLYGRQCRYLFNINSNQECLVS